MVELSYKSVFCYFFLKKLPILKTPRDMNKVTCRAVFKKNSNLLTVTHKRIFV